jgi:molybdopterin-dependent oxidoreductase-like protein protein
MTDRVCLSIGGDVERPARLALADLCSLMDAELAADFHCREGWSRPGQRWRGVWLPTLLALAGAAEAAGYVTVGSGGYTAVLTREQAESEQVLLALAHAGATSPRRPGFPRLVGLPERQIGGPDRGHPRASAGDRGNDSAGPAPTRVAARIYWTPPAGPSAEQASASATAAPS